MSTTTGRKRKKNGFTQISNSLLEDTRLSWRAKGLLCYMLSRPDNWKINKTDLYKRGTEGRDAMTNALKELKQLGYLHVYPNKNAQGQVEGWVWEYDDTAFSPEILEIHISENPQETGESLKVTSDTDFQSDGFSVRRDSSTYSNTDFNNTNYNNTKSKEIKTNMSTSPQLQTEFEQLWKIYPRKMGKKKAFDSFKKARKIKKVPYETIENGLYRYLTYLQQQETDEQFILHGSTWFNQEKWLDEYVCVGVKKKPKNASEYLRVKYGEDGGNHYEPFGDGEIIDYNPEIVPEPFQGV